MTVNIPLLAAVVLFHGTILALIIGACFAISEPRRRARLPIRRRVRA